MSKCFIWRNYPENYSENHKLKKQKDIICLQSLMQIKTKPLIFNTLRIFYLQEATHNGFTTLTQIYNII